MVDEPPLPDGANSTLVRRLATILSSDVAGYSKMMGTDEETTVRTLRGHREVFDALVGQHHGRIFNTAGDAILAEFPSAVEAVRCATEIQTALQTRNAHLPPAQKMLFRMGINVGDVVVTRDGDLLGDGVNIASRIQTAAEPGGICISGSVYDQIRNKLSLQFRALGDRSFKNIDQPVRTFTITQGETGALPASSAWTDARTLRAAAIGAVVIAVLAGGGYWYYRDSETKRAEQTAMAEQLAVQKRAAEDAQRTAEEQSRRAAEAERAVAQERAATEAAKREAELQTKAQSVADAQNRTDLERKSLEADRQRLEAEKAASATAAKAQAATDAGARQAKGGKGRADAAVTPPAKSAAGNGPFDGSYMGQLCNFPNDAARKTCWPVSMIVQGGAATGIWSRRASDKASYVHATIAPDGTVSVTLDGWHAKDGTPLAGALAGRAADRHIDVEGRWANGVRVAAHWTQAP